MLSPGNSLAEMAEKLQFYDRYGVSEYYLYDPDKINLVGWERRDGQLALIQPIAEWVSPLLGVRFVIGDHELRIFYPDGSPFLTFEEVVASRMAAEAARDVAEAARDVAEARAEKLARRLRELGIDPASVDD